MKQAANRLLAFRKNASGQGLFVYAVIAGLIGLGTILAAYRFGNTVDNTLNSILDSI